jgi:predicted ester cyclase
MNRVSTGGDLDAVDEYLAPTYTIYSDPGDQWNGQSLDREAFKQRLISSRGPFPDLRFELGEFVSEEDRIALSLPMRGTNTGPMTGRAPTDRSIAVQGLTIY